MAGGARWIPLGVILFAGSSPALRLAPTTRGAVPGRRTLASLGSASAHRHGLRGHTGFPTSSLGLTPGEGFDLNHQTRASTVVARRTTVTCGLGGVVKLGLVVIGGTYGVNMLRKRSRRMKVPVVELPFEEAVALGTVYGVRWWKSLAVVEGW